MGVSALCGALPSVQTHPGRTLSKYSGYSSCLVTRLPDRSMALSGSCFRKSHACERSGVSGSGTRRRRAGGAHLSDVLDPVVRHVQRLQRRALLRRA